MVKNILLLFVLIGLSLLVNCEKKTIDILMPNVTPKNKDSYLCHSVKLDEQETTYITEFIPHSKKEVAHHMLLYSCENPGSQEEVWDCGEMNTDGIKNAPICRGRQSIIYAWAMDAPKLVLPNDVAFKTGANTNDKKYLVIQVHYANVDKFQNGETDKSGISVIGQTEPVHYMAGVYLMGTAGRINSHSEEFFETACEMKEDIEIKPFAYRAHTHKLGKVNSGYLVRNDPIVGDEEQTWTEIGRRSPQLPQMFYPISFNMTIKKGDTIAARCTMENHLDHRVYVGATGDDEMCNFYIMYYSVGKTLRNNICFSNGPPFWYFEDYKDSQGNILKNSKIPANIGDIPADQVEALKHHNHAMHHSNKENSHEMPMHDQNMPVEEKMNMNEISVNDESEEYENLDNLFDKENENKIYLLLKEMLASKYSDRE